MINVPVSPLRQRMGTLTLAKYWILDEQRIVQTSVMCPWCAQGAYNDTCLSRKVVIGVAYCDYCQIANATFAVTPDPIPF